MVLAGQSGRSRDIYISGTELRVQGEESPIYGHFLVNKDAKTIQWGEKTVLSTDDAGTTGRPQAKE